MADAKPRCKLTHTNGNVFALAGRVAVALTRAGYADRADEMWTRLKACTSYDESLRLFMEYVEVG